MFFMEFLDCLSSGSPVISALPGAYLSGVVGIYKRFVMMARPRRRKQELEGSEMTGVNFDKKFKITFGAALVTTLFSLIVLSILSVGNGAPSPANGAPGEGEHFTVAPKEGGTEDVMVLEEVKAEEHTGYERISLRFRGQKGNPRQGVPKWWAAMGSLPYYDLEGSKVPVRGVSYLELVFNGNEADLTTPGPTVAYGGPRELNTGLQRIEEARFVPAYENNTLILVLGLSERTPFRVTELSDPPRIVIDVKKARQVRD